VVIPNGLPTDKDTQKKVVWTDDTMKKEDLEKHLKEQPQAKNA
jgi:hypothetical protein